LILVMRDRIGRVFGRNFRYIFLLVCLNAIAGMAFAARAAAQDAAAASDTNSFTAEDLAMKKEWDEWNAPVKPFRLMGNIYYVGVAGISSFLITTSEGNILMDTGFEMTVSRIRDSVTKLGFRLEDIKIILNTHAHLDHAGGHALMRKLTGAKILMSEADAALLASGGRGDFTPYTDNMKSYTPAKADGLLRDGDKVTLGGVTLVCHLTPGHTKGCTTWTMDATEDGNVYHVLFFGSTSILPRVSLVNNVKYPNIAEDFTSTYKKLKVLPCDVFLAPHTGFFNFAEKAARLERGEKPNPFIDPQGYRDFVAKGERTFLEQLERERKEAGGKRN